MSSKELDAATHTMCTPQGMCSCPLVLCPGLLVEDTEDGQHCEAYIDGPHDEAVPTCFRYLLCRGRALPRYGVVPLTHPPAAGEQRKRSELITHSLPVPVLATSRPAAAAHLLVVGLDQDA